MEGTSFSLSQIGGVEPRPGGPSTLLGGGCDATGILSGPPAGGGVGERRYLKS